jgi:hypothetical protein
MRAGVLHKQLNSIGEAQASLPEWYRRAWQQELNRSTAAKYIKIITLLF